MLAAAAAVLALAVPAIWVGVEPTYRARALVRVSPKALRIAFKNEDNSNATFYRTLVNTQATILRGPIVMQRVLDQEKIRETRWYRESPKRWWGRHPSHLERLTEAVATKIHRDSELIEVSVEADHPSDAKLIANATVDEFKRFSDETSREVDVQRYETLADEHSRVQREIDGLLKTKYGVAKQLGTASPEELRSQLSTHLSRLEEEYASLDRSLKLIRADQAWLAQRDAERQNRAASDETQPAEPAPSHYTRDADWRRLRLHLKEGEQSLEIASQQFGESHPRIQEAQTRIEHAQLLLRERERQLDEYVALGVQESASSAEGAWTSTDPVTLERRAERIERQRALLGEEIERQRGKVAGAGDLASDLAQFDEQLLRKRELAATLHARLTELELEGKAPARITVESHASEPSGPDSDRRVLLTLLALGASILCGLGAGYVRIVCDPRVREAADVQGTARVPFLGQLPPMPTTRRVWDGCTPSLLESVRIVRTALLERYEEQGKGAVLITSATGETGKTSLAVLLAGSLAALGKKVLLVEADLRRPAMAERLGVDSTLGLAALLTGKADDRAVVASVGRPRFDVVFAGEIPEGFDPELLANGVFESALARWRKSYDFVLVDSPPVLPVADARILARAIGETLMVLRAAHTRRSDLVQAYGDLASAGGELLGTVLVGVRSKAGYEYDVGRYRYSRPTKVLEPVA
jgi:capsular exopolysaccharide synthesis family protein